MTPPRLEFVADVVDDGTRLDVVVAARAGIARAQAANLIREGRVQIGGGTAPKSRLVAAGERVTVELPSPPPPPEQESIPVTVVHEDEAVLVVSKPAGVVVHPAPGHARGTLVNALLARGAAGGDPDRPGIVHRLDAGTSGLMVVAKSQEAYTELVAALKARAVERVYLALTEGEPDSDTLTIDAPIGRSPRHRKKMAVVADGKPALTQVAVLERLGGTALVEARPRTGRTHQIRVHLAAAGTPVAGDPVYGRDRRLARDLGLERPFLHAGRLAFAHPTTGAPLAFEEPLPPELARALARASDLQR